MVEAKSNLRVKVDALLYLPLSGMYRRKLSIRLLNTRFVQYNHQQSTKHPSLGGKPSTTLPVLL